MKKYLIFLFFLLVLSTPIYAQVTSNVKSYIENGDLLLTGSIGFIWGLNINVGGELCLGEWNIGDVVIFDYGIGVRGLYESLALFGNYFYAGIAPFFIVHLGLWGNWDYYAGVGLGFYFSNFTTYLNTGFGIGFAALSGVTWYLANSFGITFEVAYVGYTYTWGIGITLKL